ncbi:hypothetical protein MPTK1_2g09210 [Marchantia polymorpha subsp. ruderalis]|uniref:Methyltransferase type 11 domain-containing protein n=1 Tax=Marchantia polymorpha TaxID=3197 RepID=A0A2R6XH35_MARPO|nr:hypothetical protein MARPO_0015s0204 [Marchantia polymorpha]BBN01659.1 hypothetical protein Mp_2g09210 [Marchantia polymorpha subsp. ruderalis]|eukprot:PTQ45425.1 hypothetical protein MARPO_0015s0204 [Marchantia polymorpha]
MATLTMTWSLSRIPSGTGQQFKKDACVSLRQLVSAVPRFPSQEIRTRDFVRCAVSSAPSPDVGASPKLESVTEEKVKLVCPVCQKPVVGSSSQSFRLPTAKGEFLCQSCRKSYSSKGGIIDLTIPNRASATPLGSSFFQNPLIAYVYERGYRDNFARAGFPGFDEEAQRAQDILKPARGDVIMDLSCGPGGFTRRFVTSEEYETVIAADFSEAMLEQCRGFLQSDRSVDLDKVVLVRADAARLPFATASLAGVHAGAAIHCWPNMQSSVAEISRVLKPGGIFVASTFITPSVPGFDETLRPIRETVNLLQLQIRWFAESDLRSLVESCGFINWQAYRRGRYILFSASKPE